MKASEDDEQREHQHRAPRQSERRAADSLVDPGRYQALRQQAFGRWANQFIAPRPRPPDAAEPRRARRVRRPPARGRVLLQRADLHHRQSDAAGGVNAAVPTVAAGVRVALRTGEGQTIESAQEAPTPIPVQTHALFNPTLNYVFFLLAALLPGVLQTAMVTTMAYAMGLDVETPHRLRTLRRLGGGLWPAIAGKAPLYTVLFLAVLGISDLVLFG